MSRQAARTDRWGGLTEGDTGVHTGWTYDLEFETSEHDPREIASAILRGIEAQT